jgi:hypothetical protein
MGQYLEIHSDVEQELHVKYAEIMTVLFVTLQYGPSMPIFYVIAVFHYFIYYNMARFTLIRKIKLPPSMDETLTTNYLKIMQWAPLFYLYQGYWMLSNKQIFDGWVFPRLEITQPMDTGHTIESTMTLNQTSPLFLMVLTMTFVLVCRKWSWCSRGLQKMGFIAKHHRYLVHQDLPPFFETLGRKQ